MNKKGQVGGIIVGAIAIIVCLILFQAAASNVEQGTQTVTGASTSTNLAFTTPANGAIKELTGQELVGTPSVFNTSNGTAVPSAYYSIYECVRTSDNLKGICYKQSNAQYSATVVNITYSYYQAGYIDDAGARGIAGIIVLLAAIGIGIALLPLIRSKYE